MLEQYKKLTEDTQQTQSLLTSNTRQLRIDLLSYSELLHQFAVQEEDLDLISQLVQLEIIQEEDFQEEPQQSVYICSNQQENSLQIKLQRISDLIQKRKLNILAFILTKGDDNSKQILENYEQLQHNNILTQIWLRDGLTVYCIFKKYLKILKIFQQNNQIEVK